NEAQAAAVKKQLPKLPRQNIIAESCGRDTCAAVTLGAALVGARSTTGVMAVLPADHIIPDEKKFQQVLADSFDLASRGQCTITNGLEMHQKEMAEACRRWFKVAWTPKLAKVLAREYPEVRKISIDFALLEHAQNVIVAAGDFEWDDLGSWTALARHIKADPEGNCAAADFIHVDAARNIVYDARTNHRTPIALVGLRDSVVV